MDPNTLNVDPAAPSSPTGTAPAPDPEDPSAPGAPPPGGAPDPAAAAPDPGDGADPDAGADPDGEGGEGDPGADGGAPRSRGRERIQELIAERNAAAEWGRYWYEQAQALRGAQPAAPGQPGQPGAPAANDDPGEAPKLEDFDSTEAWSAAYRDWTRKAISAEVRTETRQALEQQRAAEAREQAVAAFRTRVQQLSAVRPDALQVLGNPNLPITTTMTEVALASERGAELMYHLGQNPIEAARIARMSPAQQAAALGRLEAKLPPLVPPAGGAGAGAGGKGTPAPRRRASNAPPPPTPIDGAGTPSVDLENCDLQEFLRIRLGKRGRAPSKA